MTAVRLVEVDEAVLAELVAAAVSEAAADEVSPPLTPGPGWTPERIEWVRQLHRDARAGLDGPAGQLTWAVLADDEVVGSVRLRRVDDTSVETGIWLTRAARRRHVGTEAIRLLIDEARATGARELRADTTAGNHAAQRLMRRLGFHLAAPDGDRVDAVLELHRDNQHRDHRDPDEHRDHGAPEETVK